MTTSDALRIAYTVDDYTDPWTAAPTVVLLHSAMSSMRRLFAMVPWFARGWRVAFPLVDAAGAMKLVELSTGPGLPPIFAAARWTTDRHGIRAPRLDAAGARSIWPRELDAVFVPARAFDRAGNRLGRGKGYYDRLLARLRPDARSGAIGVAYVEQIEETVPASTDDRPVAWIATDRGLMRAQRVAR